MINPVDIAEFILPRAKRIVEFGIGDGGLAAAFKAIQPAAEFVGVDTAKISQEIKTEYSLIVRDTLFGFDFNRHGITEVDCLIYHSQFMALDGKTLSETLSNHARYLNPSGQILLLVLTPQELSESISPAVFWDIDELQRSVEGAGLVIDRTIGIASKNSRAAATNSPQVVCIRVTKSPLTSQLLIALPSTLEEVCAPVRIEAPLQYLANEVGVYKTEQQQLLRIDEGDNIYIFHRYFARPVIEINELLSSLAQRGLVINEYDDLPTNHIVVSTNYFAIRAVHALHTSTIYLAERLKEFNPNVLVFPNQLTKLPPARQYGLEAASGKPITIFFGALNRRNDWQDIMPVLNELIKQYKNRIYFKVAADKEFFQKLNTTHKEYVGGEFNEGNFAPIDLYHTALHKADIALLPLKDNEFNRCKSDLKFIESAGHGAVVLASPTVYQDSVDDGVTGIIYHSPREFGEYFRVLVDNADIRQAIAMNAYNYVKNNRMLSQHYEERLVAYRHLLLKHEELEADRRMRIANYFPEITS